MSSFSDIVPPGFRFHPTEEELVDYYLRKRVASIQIDLDVIKDVDLYRIEPWDLQELCNMGTEDQSDYYFFSHKDKKYPTGTRTNRATKEGFWKATGRDKAIYVRHRLISMRKTLVYYKGRAPNGQKLDWIMHEYRLETDENAPPQEEGWVVCRMFKKRMVITNLRKEGEHHHHDESSSWYDEQASTFIRDMDYSPMQMMSSPPYDPNNHLYFPSNNECKEEQQLGHSLHYIPPQVDSSIRHDLPQLQEGLQQYGFYDQQHNMGHNVMCGSGSNSFRNDAQQDKDQMSTGWRVLDRFVASQLSHGDHAGDKNNYLNYNGAAFEVDHDT